MKRFIVLLLLIIGSLFLMWCISPKKAFVEESANVCQAKYSIEELEKKLSEMKKKLQATEDLLIKRTAERDMVKSELNQLVRRSDMTPKEIREELVKDKSKLESQMWFQEIKRVFNNLKVLERDVVVFSRQKDRLMKLQMQCEQSLDTLKRIRENEQVYIPGEDPEMDEFIAQGDILSKENEFNNLSSGEQMEIDIEVDKLMSETFENSATKIPGLKLKSIDKLPALPDFASKVEYTSNLPKILFGRIKNDCNKIVEKVQQEAAEYFKEKQPEEACSCWLDAIAQLNETVDNASSLDSFSEEVFMEYTDDLETCKNETLHIMSEPYFQTLIKCVKNMENKDPDWDAIAESLEGILRINSPLSQSEIDTLADQVEIIRSLLGYLIRQNDWDAKVKSKRLESILAKVDDFLWKSKAYVNYRQAKELRESKEYEKAHKEIIEAIAKCPTNKKFLKEQQIIEDFVFKPGDRIVYLVNNVKFAFRWCPAGTFQMGSPKTETGRNEIEKQRQVTFSHGFFIMETEVTQRQWKAIMGNNPSRTKGDDLPMEQVSWKECQDFCKKCTELGLPVQLPTESQWEYACRAGSLEAYSGALDEVAWYSSNSGHKLHPVKQKKPNAWGLFDMHGNVWECCQDWNPEYSGSCVTDPIGVLNGSKHALRGGGCTNEPHDCRSAGHTYCEPNIGYATQGFRCVKGK